TADPDTPLGSTDVLLPGERAAVLRDWNATASPVPDQGLAALFAAQAARTPHAVAVLDGPRSLTYAELDQRANHLAHRLAAAGTARDEAVAVAVPRSADYVTAVLAVIKA